MTGTNEVLKEPLMAMPSMAMVNQKFDQRMRELDLKRLNSSCKEVADLRDTFLDGVLFGLDMCNTTLAAPIDSGDDPKPPPPPPPKSGGKCLST